VLREHIHDAIVHSEWLYFLSMFRAHSPDKERIELYLGILSSEKGRREKKPKKGEMPITTEQQQPRAFIDGKGKLISSGQTELNLTEIKLDKRFSENWKPSPATLPCKPTKEVKVTPEPFILRKTISMED
jgi:hypothetical protein